VDDIFTYFVADPDFSNHSGTTLTALLGGNPPSQIPVLWGMNPQHFENVPRTVAPQFLEAPVKSSKFVMFLISSCLKSSNSS